MKSKWSVFTVIVLAIVLVVTMSMVGCKATTAAETTAVAATAAETTAAETTVAETTAAETTAAEATTGPMIYLNVDNDGTLEWDPGSVWQAQQFEKMYPNIKINFQITNWEVHAETLMRMATGAQAPFDVFQLHDQFLAGVVGTGIFLPLEIPNDTLSLYPDWLIEAMKDKDGNIVLTPIASNSLLFFYNTELFKAAGIEGPPKTWDDIISYAQKTTDSGKGIWGFTISNDGTADFFHWVLQAGGQPFGDNWKATFNSDAGVTALQFLCDTFNKYKVNPIDAISWSAEEEQLFVNGMAAMCVTKAYVLNIAANDAESKVKGKFAVCMWPEGPGKTKKSVIETLWYGIPNTIDPLKKDAAMKWCNYVASQEAQIGMMTHEPGNFSALPTAFDDPEVMSSIPFADVLKDVMANGQSYQHPKQGELASIVLSEIQAAMLGQKTAKEALDSAAAQADALIK